MKKKILITGAAGTIGSRLVKDLLAEGHIVVGMDNLSTGKISNLKWFPDDRFFYLEMDVCSPKVLTQKELINVDEIYHLASIESPSFYNLYPFETISVNTTGTKNMLELAKRTKAKMIFTSTNAVMMLPEWRAHDGHAHLSDWGADACYIEAKRLGEVLCCLYFNQYQTKVQVARIFNYNDIHLQRFYHEIIQRLKKQMERDDAFGEIICIEKIPEETSDPVPLLEVSTTFVAEELVSQPDNSTIDSEKPLETTVINKPALDIHNTHDFINILTNVMHKKEK